jgi:hypothetical protein
MPKHSIARPNGGQFKPGPDPRRHKFTREECVRGGRIAFALVVFEILPARYDDDRSRTFHNWLKRNGRMR